MKILEQLLRRKAPAGPKPSIVLAPDPDPMFFEQCKALRAKFDYRAEAMGLHVVAVTSSIAGEGKTFLTATLAANLAAAGRKKVLLVDMDLRKSDVAPLMRLPSQPGLSEFLCGTAGMEEVVRSTATAGLHVVPGGLKLSSPADLLQGARFRAFLREARDTFDFVLVDTPPVLPVADTLSLKGQVDGFLFVCRADMTPAALIRQAVDEVGEQNVVGVVLNGCATRSQRYYRKYYGNYYQPPAMGAPPS